ncbi:hypothetical protein FJT64_001180 [Amphibalanus amphitrite]|uniref:Reverse transcriptase domain-containing protein n=1 Tax=Amphibalanus amphitrite TaxID=1232801 RepID=A0A6A4VAF3_AMPAM|nr:hypothetical protein FJT64_001180 [Amphibalanus amphitrite]
MSPKPPKDLTDSLKSLTRDNTRVIVPADKAKALVVINKTDYTAALLRSLQSPVYEEVTSDPAEVFSGRFNEHLLTALTGPAVRGRRRDKMLKENDADGYQLYRRLSKTHGRCGPFYGLVKTHKYTAPPTTEEERLHWIANLKLRPICPAHRGADYELTKHLTACLKVLPRPPHSISSPLQVLDMLQNMDHSTNSCRLISLDVEAMFPSIPTQEAIALIRTLLQDNRDALSDVTCLKPDALKREASKIGIQLVSKPSLTIGSLLCSKAKHHLPKLQESNVVYKIECSCQVDGDPVVYIGETDRELGTRVREHRESWTGAVRSRANASAFSAHRDCSPAFDEVKVLNRASHYQMRLLLESAYIRTVGRREAVLVYGDPQLLLYSEPE